LLGTIENDPEPVTNIADNAELGPRVWREIDLRCFSNRHDLPQNKAAERSMTPGGFAAVGPDGVIFR